MRCLVFLSAVLLVCILAMGGSGGEPFLQCSGRLVEPDVAGALPGLEDLGHIKLSDSVRSSLLPLLVHDRGGESSQQEESVSWLGDLSVSNLPHVAYEGNPFRSFVPREVFADRYRGATNDELEAAKELLHDETSRLMTQESEKLIVSGRADIEVVDRSEIADDSPMPPKGIRDNLVTTRRTEVLPSGDLLVQTAKLPWDEYVALYDLQDELCWVILELNRRSGTVANHSHDHAADQGVHQVR